MSKKPADVIYCKSDKILLLPVRSTFYFSITFIWVDHVTCLANRILANMIQGHQKCLCIETWYFAFLKAEDHYVNGPSQNARWWETCTVLSLCPTLSMANSLPTVSDMILAILDILLSANLPVEHWNKEGTQQRWAELTQMRKKTFQPTHRIRGINKCCWLSY